jgi:RNase P subunit RPR2
MKIIKEGKAPWAGWAVTCSQCKSRVELENSDRYRYGQNDQKASCFSFDCDICGAIASLNLIIEKDE